MFKSCSAIAISLERACGKIETYRLLFSLRLCQSEREMNWGILFLIFLKLKQSQAGFARSNDLRWDQNVINGQYIIGYSINDKLDSLNKQVIPKVLAN